MAYIHHFFPMALASRTSIQLNMLRLQSSLATKTHNPFVFWKVTGCSEMLLVRESRISAIGAIRVQRS
jgi:hypothetical protein